MSLKTIFVPIKFSVFIIIFWICDAPSHEMRCFVQTPDVCALVLWTSSSPSSSPSVCVWFSKRIFHIHIVYILSHNCTTTCARCAPLTAMRTMLGAACASYSNISDRAFMKPLMEMMIIALSACTCRHAICVIGDVIRQDNYPKPQPEDDDEYRPHAEFAPMPICRG